MFYFQLVLDIFVDGIVDIVEQTFLLKAVHSCAK